MSDKRWQVIKVSEYNFRELATHLAAGWEPFAVQPPVDQDRNPYDSQPAGYATVWLRKLFPAEFYAKQGFDTRTE